MVLKHHTLSPFDRKPQGAVAAGGQVRLRVTAEGDQMPLELFLRVWNGAERRYPMRSLGVRNGKTVYEAQIGVGDTPNLLWYRFEGVKLRLADNTFYTPDFAVMSAAGTMEMHEVSPGDSMPTRLINPGNPLSASWRMTKSLTGSVGDWIFGRTPAMSAAMSSRVINGK